MFDIFAVQGPPARTQADLKTPSDFERKIVRASHTRPCDECGELDPFSMGAVFWEEPFSLGMGKSNFMRKSVWKPDQHTRPCDICRSCAPFRDYRATFYEEPYDDGKDTQYTYGFEPTWDNGYYSAGKYCDEDPDVEEPEYDSGDVEAADEGDGEDEEDTSDEEEDSDHSQVNVCTDLALVPGQSVTTLLPVYRDVRRGRAAPVAPATPQPQPWGDASVGAAARAPYNPTAHNSGWAGQRLQLSAHSWDTQA
ncbi:hypothetical protein COCSUDRAFT_57933 [Coccomyxa subellipsoidea C-169]|uniref:Uncharacterized protein n=1 Tax=Coccomyxa subellipsoidea (strain C-169) TaxID=574566 RepID=I0YP91_COCSC|nr:hypothetical protein COCSUDRAFT_57933 [Coccomyxa subellipsoidea C-169]EIE20210.1 hypothetical protein COCSUDRAFT_57933 [Coccomyxa subellipsoidea C-169]|eukprot:XP_005644754.1 hypothetical protein COCSUDRAFT_57933 [Coccomyxa subellipsoidea C-169]